MKLNYLKLLVYLNCNIHDNVNACCDLMCSFQIIFGGLGNAKPKITKQRGVQSKRQQATWRNTALYFFTKNEVNIDNV